MLLAGLAAGARAARADDRFPCPSIAFASAATIKLTDSERKLVCGDPKVEGWKRIPLNQAEYFMRVFLQQRGYQNPAFSVARAVLRVDAGPKSLVTALRVEGLPAGLDAGKLRMIVGQALTPATLDKVKAALLVLLQ
ncbi:MAG TPA: hypothetical protein VH309_03585, partial [Elusimicrobiota bacterium]|nr:hypothetical protein [Elusimicrobiota bacterium]